MSNDIREHAIRKSVCLTWWSLLALCFSTTTVSFCYGTLETTLASCVCLFATLGWTTLRVCIESGFKKRLVALGFGVGIILGEFPAGAMGNMLMKFRVRTALPIYKQAMETIATHMLVAHEEVRVVRHPVRNVPFMKVTLHDKRLLRGCVAVFPMTRQGLTYSTFGPQEANWTEFVKDWYWTNGCM